MATFCASPTTSPAAWCSASPRCTLPRGSVQVVAAARRQQQQGKKKRSGSQSGGDGGKPTGGDRRMEFVVEDAPGTRDGPSELVIAASTSRLPRAPSPGRLRDASPDPDVADGGRKPYAVFAPPPSNIQSAPWSWGEDDAAAPNEPPIPEWNPRTGFMRTVQPEEEEEAAAPAGTSSSSSGSGAAAGDDSRGAQRAAQAAAPPPEPTINLLTPQADPAAAATSEPLPPASQSQVMTSCVGTTFWMTVLAFFLRTYAQANAPLVLGTDEALLASYLDLPSGLSNWGNVAILLGAAGIVTAARYQLLNVWPDFRVATERSNAQILTNLSWLDIALVALMTGFSEELLFRGAIIPGSFLDWRGVLLSGVIFGLLHNSGGRNMAFAAWASAVGCLYGGAFLYTHNIWVPAAAHSVANFASAALWRTAKRKGPQP